jgi:hypothetical protein
MRPNQQRSRTTTGFRQSPDLTLMHKIAAPLLNPASHQQQSLTA